MERALVYSVRTEIRRQSIILFILSWEHVYRASQVFAVLHMSMNDYESAASIDLGIAYILVNEF